MKGKWSRWKVSVAKDERFQEEEKRVNRGVKVINIRKLN